jgi:hypothetical protein
VNVTVEEAQQEIINLLELGALHVKYYKEITFYNKLHTKKLEKEKKLQQ